MNLDALQARLGHTFHNRALLESALTHPAYANEHPDAGEHYQRLEFLGDAVIQFVITDALFRLRPLEREGELSRLRVALANGVFLGELARELDIPAHIRLCTAEQKTGGSPSLAGDVYEAIVGAIFIDAGLPAAQDFIHRAYGDLEARLASLAATDINPKGRLQEHIQAVHGTGVLRYETAHISGEDHNREYEARIYLKDDLLGTGRGTSKKLAEESAARAALTALS